MAIQSAILSISGELCNKTAALANGASTAEIILGPDCIFVINATKDMTIRFGTSGMPAAAATDYRVPANQQTTFYTSVFDRIRVFNVDTAAGDVYVQKLSRF